VEIEELLLTTGKPPDIHDASGVDAHSLEGRAMGYGGNYEPSVVLETHEAAIEKMINARC
jgi:hypothetical protein